MDRTRFLMLRSIMVTQSSVLFKEIARSNSYKTNKAVFRKRFAAFIEIIECLRRILLLYENHSDILTEEEHASFAKITKTMLNKFREQGLVGDIEKLGSAEDKETFYTLHEEIMQKYDPVSEHVLK